MVSTVRPMRPGTIKGRPVPTTVHDGRGTAHILKLTTEGSMTLCGRPLELAGKVNHKSCKACSDAIKGRAA